jgi:hypothetical protein
MLDRLVGRQDDEPDRGAVRDAAVEGEGKLLPVDEQRVARGIEHDRSPENRGPV